MFSKKTIIKKTKLSVEIDACAGILLTYSKIGLIFFPLVTMKIRVGSILKYDCWTIRRTFRSYTVLLLFISPAGTALRSQSISMQ